MVIVLHAPSDKEVETVDEILGYAAKFRELGTALGRRICQAQGWRACSGGTDMRSFPGLSRRVRHHLHVPHLPRRARARHEEPHGVPDHLLLGRKCLGHGHQGTLLTCISCALDCIETS